MKTTTPSSDGKVNTMKRYVVKTDSVDRKKENNIPSEDNLILEDKTEFVPRATPWSGHSEQC